MTERYPLDCASGNGGSALARRSGTVALRLSHFSSMGRVHDCVDGGFPCARQRAFWDGLDSWPSCSPFQPSNSNTPNPCSNRGLLGRDPKMGSAVLLPARLVMVAAGLPILPVADRAEAVGRHTK